MQCVVCDSEKVSLTAGANFTFSSNGRIDQCKSCDSSFMRRFPEPNILEQFYELQHKNEKRKPWDIHLIFTDILRRIRLVYARQQGWSLLKKHLVGYPNLLVYGGRNTGLLKLLKKKGFNLTVVDPLQFYRDQLHKAGFREVQKSLLDVAPHKPFDACLMFESLQYESDPIDTLKQAKALLCSTGKIMGLVADAPVDFDILSDSLKLSIFNSDSLVHYSRKGLEFMFNKAGIEKLSFSSVHWGERKPNEKLLFCAGGTII